MRALTVSQLNMYVKSLIDCDEIMKNTAVVGEISNLTVNARSGHIYFTLKDSSCSIKAVMFRTAADRLKFLPEDGMNVTAYGRVSVYERDGVYQFYTETLIPSGLGGELLRFRQLKDKLEAEGLFEPSAKKPLPPFPSVIGVATSPVGAALQDILNILSRRYPMAEVEIYPCTVQGDGCPSSVINALGYFNRQKKADIIIIARGGGSYEDLSCFNDEALARAVYASDIPVISAIGHETDFTIVDFVSSLRAPTPSAAAELAVPDISELKAYVLSYREKLAASVKMTVENYELRFIHAKKGLDLSRYIENREIRYDNAFTSLLNAVSTVLERKSSAFTASVSKLEALNPLNVLMRGYAAVYKDGKNVTGISDINENDRLEIKMKDGVIDCVAKGKTAGL